MIQPLHCSLLRLLHFLSLLAALVLISSDLPPILKADERGAKTDEPPAAKKDAKSPSPVIVKNVFLKFTHRATLSFERAGTLAKLPFREGDTVEANCVLAQLDDNVARKVLAIAEAEAVTDVKIRAARKAQESADVEYQAVLAANQLAKKTYPETEVQRRKLAAQTAELGVEQQVVEFEIAKLRRDQAAAELETHALRAPFKGFLSNVFCHVGEAVQVREHVVELVNVQQLRAEGYVDLKDVWLIRSGDAVEVRIDSVEGEALEHPRVYRGSLQFVDVSAQTVRRVVRVWAEIENEDGQLRDGLTAEMTIFPRGGGKTTPAPPANVGDH